jgi:hypothetical protein
MAEINAEDDKEQHISEKIARGESFKISATIPKRESKLWPISIQY